jgi:multidrug efflux pump subunit AcrB
MDYVRFAIDNPVKVIVGVLLLLLFGVLSLSRIPVQLVPNVEKPTITVETNWPRGSPQEIEKEIVKEQEEKLKRVSSLKKMTSISQQGDGQITLEFYIGTNLDRAMQEVSDKLREVPQYPPDADEPVISAADVGSAAPMAWMVFTCDDPDFDVEGIYHDLDQRVRPYLERIAGVARVNIFGGREREVHVQVNPRRLAQRRITFDKLRDSLRRENVNVSAGDVASGRVDVRVRTVGEYDNLDAIRRTIVTYDEGGPVRVQDVATVTQALAKATRMVRSRGRPAVAMNCVRETGSNSIQVMAELDRRIEEMNDPKHGLLSTIHPGLQVQKVYDETLYIHDSVSLVTDNLKYGGLLAVLVLLLFLRDIRLPWLFAPAMAVLVASIIGFFMAEGGYQTAWLVAGVVALGLVLISSPATLIITFAIPISVIGTFVAMTAAGRSINVISLAGLAFAVGMVVDNAIVVLENIDRHLNLGKPARQAAYDATKEVWGAVLASTLTTLAVFLPVLTVQEEAGQLFRDIALAICASVTLSLIVSVTVIPVAAARLLHARKHHAHHQPSAFRRAIRGLFGLTWLLNHVVAGFSHAIYWLTGRHVAGVALRIVVVAFFTVASLVLADLLMPPTTYLPAGNRNLVIGMMFTPPSYSIAQNRLIGDRIESQMSPFWAFDDGKFKDPDHLPDVYDRTGAKAKVPPIENFFFVVRRGSVFIGAASADKSNVKGLMPLFESAGEIVPGAFVKAFQTSIFSRGLGGTNSVDVELRGDNLDDLGESADALAKALAPKYGRPQKSPQNYDLPGPELQFWIDRIRAADMGVDVASLGLAVQSMVDGAVVGDYRDRGDTIDLVMIRDPKYPLEPELLSQVPVAYKTPAGQEGIVPLSSLAQLQWADAPQEIDRIEERRAIKLTVTSPEDEALEQTDNNIKAMIGPLREANAIKPGVQVVLAGTADQLSEVRSAMIGDWTGWNAQSLESVLSSRFVLALIITYLLMAALFESFLYPFVIMFSVPLAAVGGFMGLSIVHHYNPTQLFDVLTMLGFVILIGIVVNNAILIVHQALNFMRGLGEGEGDQTGKLSPREAIRLSVKTRIRPVFMTTLTSVFGMLPLVLMPGSGSELYRGLGSVVIGGLLVSTVFTLLVVPLVFSLVLDAKRVVLKALGRSADELVTGQVAG